MVAGRLGKYLFKTICALATLGLLSMGLYQYILDHDKSVVHTRSFFETQDDVLPVMSNVLNNFLKMQVSKTLELTSQEICIRIFY